MTDTDPRDILRRETWYYSQLAERNKGSGNDTICRRDASASPEARGSFAVSELRKASVTRVRCTKRTSPPVTFSQNVWRRTGHERFIVVNPHVLRCCDDHAKPRACPCGRIASGGSRQGRIARRRMRACVKEVALVTSPNCGQSSMVVSSSGREPSTVAT